MKKLVFATLLAAGIVVFVSGSSSAAPAPAPAADDGCWVKVWEHKTFAGRTVTWKGPMTDARLGDDNWPGNDDEVGDDIDSLEAGPGAWAEVYEDESFSDTMLRVHPG